MRLLAACLLTCLVAACAAFDGNNPHEDSPGQPAPERGPTLCHDGSTPPCPQRS
jgi:hypothetical protein